MKNLFILCSIFTFLSLSGQEKKVMNPPPPAKYSLKKTEDNKVYYKVDKKIEFNTSNFSSSFDYSILDNYTPVENIFIISFIAELDSISNIKIEKGKDYEIIMELRRKLFRLRFHPATIKNKPVKSFCKLKFIFDYKNQVIKTIIL